MLNDWHQQSRRNTSNVTVTFFTRQIEFLVVFRSTFLPTFTDSRRHDWLKMYNRNLQITPLQYNLAPNEFDEQIEKNFSNLTV